MRCASGKQVYGSPRDAGMQTQMQTAEDTGRDTPTGTQQPRTHLGGAQQLLGDGDGAESVDGAAPGIAHHVDVADGHAQRLLGVDAGCARWGGRQAWDGMRWALAAGSRPSAQGWRRGASGKVLAHQWL